MTAPRTVFARRSSTRTRLHVPPRTLAIVVVPDLLGTRLMTPDGEALVWNPLGAPFGSGPCGFKVEAELLARPDLPLVPAERFRAELAADRDRARHIAHIDALVADVYEPLVFELADLASDALRDHNTQVRVYCCGYDWRQDHTRSALRLAAVVEEALQETGERRVVIVAHGAGGAVARTYCRVLGGESRVIQMFLVGAATLGTPEAYRALKDGLGGVYAKQFVARCAEADARGAVLEGVGIAAEVAEAAVSAEGPAGFARDLFGGLYTLLCVSSSRHPSRDETRSLVRQFPSVYQMLPGALYCRDHPTWLTFDPAATGHPPAGYTVVLPTMLEAGTTLTLGPALALAGQPGALRQVNTTFGALGDAPEDAAGRAEVVTSARAWRNVDTLATLLAKGTDVMGAALAGVRLGQRAARLFLDCRSPDALYRDIYTGLLDAVEERPLCAAHLAGARHLDRSLTAHPKDTPPETGVRALGDALQAMGAALAPVTQGLREWAAAYGEATAKTWSMQRADMAATWSGEDRAQAYERFEAERHARDERARREEAERARARAEDEAEEAVTPRAYVHPATVCIAGAGPRGRAVGAIVPLRVVSRDDSNVVRWIRLPLPVPIDGDGNVPADSAAPPADSLTAPFVGDVTRVPGAGHAELPAHDLTLQRIAQEIDALLPRFIES